MHWAFVDLEKAYDRLNKDKTAGYPVLVWREITVAQNGEFLRGTEGMLWS